MKCVEGNRFFLDAKVKCVGGNRFFPTQKRNAPREITFPSTQKRNQSRGSYISTLVLADCACCGFSIFLPSARSRVLGTRRLPYRRKTNRTRKLFKIFLQLLVFIRKGTYLRSAVSIDAASAETSPANAPCGTRWLTAARLSCNCFNCASNDSICCLTS